MGRVWTELIPAMRQQPTQPIYQVDAFTDVPFKGNPAAVVPLDDWPADAWLQAVAAENNLAETAFFVPAGDAFELRWFTPTVEIALCGHATLASAFVLFECLDHEGDRVVFETRHSGELTVAHEAGRYWLALPRHGASPAEPLPGLIDAVGGAPTAVTAGANWLLAYESETEVRELAPDMLWLRGGLQERGVIATAPADDPALDFVSRYFVPNFGVDEDPVTGSAHCMLAPYWARVLGRERLAARQISLRGGRLDCAVDSEHVHVGGDAVLYLDGHIHLPGADTT